MGGVNKKAIGRRRQAVGTRRACEVCLRRLSPRALTILRDDTGEHELCGPCEERWSRQVMTFFAKDLMAWSLSSAWRKAA